LVQKCVDQGICAVLQYFIYTHTVMVLYSFIDFVNTLIAPVIWPD